MKPSDEQFEAFQQHVAVNVANKHNGCRSCGTKRIMEDMSNLANVSIIQVDDGFVAVRCSDCRAVEHFSAPHVGVRV
jgi:hypothetical protein